jgi:hypothetical protein
MVSDSLSVFVAYYDTCETLAEYSSSTDLINHASIQTNRHSQSRTKTLSTHGTCPLLAQLKICYLQLDYLLTKAAEVEQDVCEPLGVFGESHALNTSA